MSGISELFPARAGMRRNAVRPSESSGAKIIRMWRLFGHPPSDVFQRYDWPRERPTPFAPGKPMKSIQSAKCLVVGLLLTLACAALGAPQKFGTRTLEIPDPQGFVALS